MKVLVTGYSGQLGYDIVNSLDDIGVECIGVDQSDFSITDKNAVSSYILKYKPEVIVHCAAYTAVDEAESNKELCYDVNVLGTKYIAEVAKTIKSKMVYISTDYIFSGEDLGSHDIDDKADPVNYYGYSKWLGEEAVRSHMDDYFIIRVSWVFGSNGNNFVNMMLRLSEKKNKLFIVEDQLGSPTYTCDLAHLIIEMIKTNKYGTYHATNEGFCSWFEFAKEIFRITNREIDVQPISSKNFPTAAARPKNSRLNKVSLDRGGFHRLPEWKDALRRYLE